MLTVLASAAEPPPAKPAAAAPGSPATETAAALDALAASMVRVEYWLKTNEGEEPTARTARAEMRLVEEERPVELAGWLLAAGKVLTPDPGIHPRFVRSISVRLGTESVPATVGGYAEHQEAVYLNLERPLKTAKPLAFEAGAKGPYLAVTRSRQGGLWVASAAPLAMLPARAEDGRKFVPAPANSLILGAGGRPAGMAASPELPADDSWRGSPLNWPIISAARMARRLRSVEGRANRGLLRVTMEFRSPRKGSAEARATHGRDGTAATFRQAVGVVMDEGRLLVLEELKPQETARLERITAHTLLDAAIPAKFKATLSEYGCLVAELSRPMPNSIVRLSDADIRRHRGAMLLAAEIGFYGEQRLAVYEHTRITGFETRWKNRLYPLSSGDASDCFLFDPLGVLVALPVKRRAPVTMAPPDHEELEAGARLTPAAHLEEQLADLAAHGDPANVPLTEAQEGRLAWMGVILQPLNRELARLHNVSVETNDGDTGALVAHVYPDSPAARAGIKPGAVLLRLHVKGQPLPIDVRVPGDDPYYYEDEDYIGEDDDELAADSYRPSARPWVPAEDALTRALTDLGFGREYTAELRVGELPVRKFLKVVESPPHFDTARRHKTAELGMTVRDLTFEVRRYYHMKSADPGVIVSAVEPGGKAAVADIRPFEIVVQVNGRPVADVREFAAACSKQTELRLAVRRLARERQVKIRLPGAPGAPEPPKQTTKQQPGERP